MKVTRRTTMAIATVVLALMLALSASSTLATANSTNLLKNGDFEDGFNTINGCGAVGADWHCFNTGGRGGYGFYDDEWDPVVASGKHAQLIEINTKKDSGDENRTAGIYQTVDVTAGETYTLTFKALMRSNDVGASGDPWRYIMLVGFTHDGSSDWGNATVQAVDVGPIQERVNPSGYHDVSVTVKAKGDKLTIFIAGRMKWSDGNREVDFDIDKVVLTGPPVEKKTPATKEAAKTPEPEPALVCDGPNLLANGGFEEGFDADGTAEMWEPFNNDGRANYGYYDDAWPLVVADGDHAQLLEINTHGWWPTDTERWTGIYQTIPGTPQDPTYQLSLKVMIREAADHHDEDPWRYEVYWGLNTGGEGINDVSELEILQGIPVSDIHLRTNPGEYVTYTTRFEASGETMQLYLLGLKKWATVEREVDFDFDSITLQRCHLATVDPDPPATASQAPASDAAKSCSYIIQHGDYLGRIAKRYGTTVSWLTKNNRVANPSLIYAGQPLKVPCAAQTVSNPAPAGDAINGSKAVNSTETSQKEATTASATATTTASKADQASSKKTTSATKTTSRTAAKKKAKPRIHVVRRGECLSVIAYRYHTTVRTLQRLNHIRNPRMIRPGQKLRLPSS